MVALSFAARHVEPGSGDYWCWRAFADRCPMQDSNPQADGNAEARSRDVTSGGLIGVLTPCCATGRGYRLRRTAPIGKCSPAPVIAGPWLRFPSLQTHDPKVLIIIHLGRQRTP